MENIKIRISNETDFERIFEIWLENQSQAIGKHVDSTDIEGFRQDLSRLFFKTPRCFFYVAELESRQIIGWQGLLPLLSNPIVGKYMAQSSTYIDKTFVNRDVGSRLVEYAVNDAKRLGIEHIYGWVKADNAATNKISENFNTHKFFIPSPNGGGLPDFNLYVVIV